jgi:predicted permease
MLRFFHRRRWDRERETELRAHLEIETAENIARGMTPGEARDAARRKLGNPTKIREEIYRMNTISFLESLWHDLRHAARLLRINPGFAAVAVLSLALGIGANTAIFQLLDAVRLRSLPVLKPHELVEVKINGRGRMGNFRGRYAQFTNPLWEELRQRQQALDLFAWGDTTVNLARTGEVRYAEGLWVSGSFFPVLGVRPVIGRLFTPEEDRRGCGNPGAVISYAFWQREFGGSSEILAKTLPIGDNPVPIIGVTPAEFFGVEVGRRFDVALPVCSMQPGLDDRMFWYLTVMGRLKPGWSIDQTRANLESISPSVFDATVPRYSPEDQKHYRALKLAPVESGSGISALRTSYERPLFVLMAMVAFVLLIACANVANMMLARATARAQEFGVRLSIGASRGRLFRQLLTESLLLAIVGGVTGAVLAKTLTGILVSQLRTPRDPIFLDLSMDWRVLGFTAALSCMATVLFGVAPALRAGRLGLDLRSSGRGFTASREKFTIRRVLLTAQVALCLVLLTGAMLFVRSFQNLTSKDLGFRQEGVLIANTFFSETRYPPERRQAAYRALEERLKSVPGVSGVARAFMVPVSGSGWDQLLTAKGNGPAKAVHTQLNSVTGDYLRVMGIALVGARIFGDQDSPGSPRVAIVNEEFARRAYDGATPLGKTIQLQGAFRADYEVVGVVKNSVYRDVKEPAVPMAYIAATQEERPRSTARFILHSTVPPESLIASVKQVLAESDPELSVRFAVLSSMIGESLIRERLMATLSAFFGVLAAVLAVVGLYGVVSCMVARRRSEIGIRMALGADRGSILRLILGEIGVLLVAGLFAGSALSLSIASTIRTLLFGLQPNDPVTMAAALLSLATVAFAAAYFPAARAARLDPLIALREE